MIMSLSEFIKQLQQIESEINRNAHQAISDSLRFYIDLPVGKWLWSYENQMIILPLIG